MMNLSYKYIASVVIPIAKQLVIFMPEYLWSSDDLIYLFEKYM